MLVLTRLLDQVIRISDGAACPVIEITVLEARGSQVRLGVTAPCDVPVDRLEVALQREEGARRLARDRALDEALSLEVGSAYEE